VRQRRKESSSRLTFGSSRRRSSKQDTAEYSVSKKIWVTEHSCSRATVKDDDGNVNNLLNSNRAECTYER
jgi:hypothetical protein